MIIFRNDGLIDVNAVRTMGVNVKERPGAFGHFGTGLKFAIATILRGGGSVIMYRGTDSYDFRTRPALIRGEEFRIVQMTTGPGSDFEDLGFTDQLGKNWEPWMVLREFGCNCLDEGGEFWQGETDCYSEEGKTTFEVSWDALEEAFEERDSIFCNERQEIIATDSVQVLEGESAYLFYRGIRAYKLERPSVVTYNILSQQTLTEDRTIAHFYYPLGEIRKLWLTECHDQALLLRILAPEGERFEHKIDYNGTNREASKEFIDTVLDARMDKKVEPHLNKSAQEVLRQHLRSTRQSGMGWANSRYLQDEFSMAIDAIAEIFDEDELKLDRNDLPLVLVEDDEIDEEAVIEKGRIFISRSLLRQGRRSIADTLLPLLLELRFGDYVSIRELTPILVRPLLQSHPDLRVKPVNFDTRTDEEMEESEERKMSVVDNLLVAMDVRGEEFPKRPSEL